MELTPTLILNLTLLIVPPVVLVLVFRQWLARYVRWTVALTALCDILLFWDELFYYESFGLFRDADSGTVGGHWRSSFPHLPQAKEANNMGKF